MSTLRSDLNDSSPNQLADTRRRVQSGDLMTLLIKSLTATEAGVVPAAHVATLAATPTSLYQINATAGAVTGIKKLRRGPITGSGAILPATGEAVWDGGVKVLFNVADAVTAASFTYVTATDKASLLLATLEDASA
jgi:hypothetical protein